MTHVESDGSKRSAPSTVSRKGNRPSPPPSEPFARRIEEVARIIGGSNPHNPHVATHIRKLKQQAEGVKSKSVDVNRGTLVTLTSLVGTAVAEGNRHRLVYYQAVLDRKAD